ncbi:hypothetical protein ASG41_17455 [Modestobacter sp. Leaf380]|nr:hypothetical protein ASG41_17455 [Modestobacter sp. Leaf380]
MFFFAQPLLSVSDDQCNGSTDSGHQARGHLYRIEGASWRHRIDLLKVRPTVDKPDTDGREPDKSQASKNDDRNAHC